LRRASMEHTPGLETSPPGSDTLDVAGDVRTSAAPEAAATEAGAVVPDGRSLAAEFAVPALALAAVLGVAAVVFAEPLLALVGAADGFTATQTAFMQRPQTLLWLLVLCGQGGLWVVLGVAAVAAAREVAGGRDRRAAWIGGALLLVGVSPAVIVPLLDLQDYPLPHHGPKLGLITFAALAAAVPAFVTVFRIRRRVEQAMAPENRHQVLLEHDRPAGTNDLAGFLHLRDLLHRALGSSAR
jgi:hypothetical protein